MTETGIKLVRDGHAKPIATTYVLKYTKLIPKPHFQLYKIKCLMNLSYNEHVINEKFT